MSPRELTTIIQSLNDSMAFRQYKQMFSILLNVSALAQQFVDAINKY